MNLKTELIQHDGDNNILLENDNENNIDCEIDNMEDEEDEEEIKLRKKASLYKSIDT